MRSLPQWVVWRYATRKGRRTKVPFRADLPEAEASTTDPSTWSSSETALASYLDEDNRLDGIGFVFAPDDGLAGVDLDNCLDEAGNVLDWARPYLDRLVGYAEVSPSGRGIKAFVRGRVPGGKGRKLQKLGPDGTGAVEVYGQGRYFTVTGRVIDEAHSEIGDGSAAFAELHAEWFPPKPARPRSPDPAPLGLDDEELIRKAERSGNGARFSALMGGSIDGHPSKSEADLALCNMLAFWTRGDPDRIDRLFRRSLLCDEKWTGRPDYRERTIAKALEGRTEFYDPRRNGQAPRPAARMPPPAAEPQSDASEPDDPGVRTTTAPMPTFANHRYEERLDEEGNTKTRMVARDVHVIDANLDAIIPGWPKRVGRQLFVPDGAEDPEPIYLDPASRFFAYVDARARIHWAKGPQFIPQERYHQHLTMTAERYDAIELMPHVPRIDGIYYMHRPLPESSGKLLDQLVDMFCPATPADREFLKALFMTPLWGGQPGNRPAFLITGPDHDPEGRQGRGVGKSKVPHIVSTGLYGGFLDVTGKEDMPTVKKRLLSPGGIHKRILLLDNVKTLKFSWDELEGLITSPTIGGWAIYQGDSERPNLLTTIITLNGPTLSADLAERCVVLKLNRPPRSVDPAWEANVRNFVAEHRWEILAEIADILASEARPLRPASRWRDWELAILSKLNNPEECQRLILERQGAVNDDASDRETFRNYICNKIREHGHDPDTALLRLASHLMAEWLSAAMRKHFETNKSTAFIKGLGIQELIPYRQEGSRGFIWNGINTPEKDPVTLMETPVQGPPRVYANGRDRAAY